MIVEAKLSMNGERMLFFYAKLEKSQGITDRNITLGGNMKTIAVTDEQYIILCIGTYYMLDDSTKEEVRKIRDKMSKEEMVDLLKIFEVEPADEALEDFVIKFDVG